MARYIDADKLIRHLYDEYHGMISDESMKIYKIIQMLDNAHTADVQEVKHGKWIIHNERQDWQDPKSYMIFIECNKCGKSHFLGTNDCANSFNYEQLKRMGTIADYNYCGLCGAKMDKEREK